ncbi:hypothetical protein EXIGLDRAFT_717837 [Exidia glandulosa HHB12029]|uniref:Uncharacterized protein n=1 Tax=Exidia glandulosa HHB12029 TaxID=1314781 RepID=A0A165I458_EXIGL|nr:hypothetical protein EXIGLDRAFT_717837 [Exidia glandulosa HHB12029]
MSRVSQRKLRSSASRDLTLHRWVLLKNLVISTDDLLAQSSSSSPSQSSVSPSPVNTPPYEYSSPSDEEVFVFPDADIFVFPDAATLVAESAAGASAEAAWLDALLDELDEDEDSEEEPVASATSVIDNGISVLRLTPALAGPTGTVSTAATVCVTVPVTIPTITASSSFSLSSSGSPPCNCTTPPPTPVSVPSTPRWLDDLPFFAHDGADDSSDDESEGPETPLLLSTLAHAPSLAAAADPAVVLSEPESYFVYPTEPVPIFPTSSLPSQAFPLQEC